jgi:lysine-specific demethylase/histidyl-hydroxylase NO66
VLLCPQKFSDQVWKLLSILEEKWNSMTTSRVQLTPKNAQAFAPRYHEYDSFVLQIEGSKSWKIYPPLDEASTLPRYPSGNLKQDEITKPVLEVTLEEGDLLYFPRGFISQANTSKDVSI